MENKIDDKKIIHISRKTFLTALIMLVCLVIVSIALTYIIPRGAFGTKIVDGVEVVDYTTFNYLENTSGINILKGLAAPILLLGSGDGITVIMLSLFILIIAGAFQAMSDCGGIKVIVSRIVRKFQNKRFLLLAIISLVFMLFGSLLGLFEEMLTLLPIMVILSLSIGYDSFTGFLVSVVSCGFGFSTAITNPFTVITASKIIGVNPLSIWWYRIIIFIVIYALMLLFIFIYTKKIKKDPTKSLTYEEDQKKEKIIDLNEKVPNEKRIFVTYLIFLLTSLAITLIFSVVDSIRDYNIVALIVVFLFGGNIAAFIAFDFNFKKSFKCFLKGVVSALPTIVFLLLASSIKYILIEGNVLPTITYSINSLVESQNPYLIAITLFGIVLALEFFISSSTAKAMFVMAILAILNLGLSKENLVLIYTFADGYTNLFFPTNPVLLIGLSMVGVSYFKWVKKTWLLFLITFLLAFGFIALAIFLQL